MDIKRIMKTNTLGILKQLGPLYYSELFEEIQKIHPGIKTKYFQDLLGALHRSYQINVRLDKKFEYKGKE